MVKVILFIFSAITLSSCSVKNSWWGEDAPPVKVAESPASTDDCPGPQKIVDGTEAQADRAIQCLENSINDAWKTIRGSEKNALWDREIHTLIDHNIVSLSDDKNLSKKKVQAVKQLLGIQDRVTKEKTDALVQWLKNNKTDIREVYNKFVARPESRKNEKILYADLTRANHVFTTLLRTTNMKIGKEELGTLLRDLIDEGKDTTTPEFMLVLFDMVGVVCPNMAKSAVWESNILASCTDRLLKDLSPGKDWFEFILNQVTNPIAPEKIQDSLNEVIGIMDRWMQQDTVEGIHPELWVKLAEKMGAKPPAEFLDSLNIISKFDPKSSGRYISPTTIGHAFHTIYYYHSFLLLGLPVFLNAFEQHKCLNQDAKNWKDCQIKVTPEMRTNNSLDIAMKVYNDDFGQNASPFNGSRFKDICLFYALSKEMILAFETENKGFISADSTNEKDEVMVMLSTILDSVDVVDRFFGNLELKLQNIPIKDQEAFSSYNELNMKGLARLVTLVGHDILARRTPKQRNLLQKLWSNVTNHFPSGSMILDQEALTAVLIEVTSLGGYRIAFTGMDGYDVVHPDSKIKSKEDPQYNRFLVDRRSVLDALPDLMKRDFPRTYESCMAFGWERSCGIAFDQVLPGDNRTTPWIAASGLDLVALVATGFESLMDSCDVDRNNRLSWSVWDGDDELDCIVVKADDITKRLMESGLVKIKEAKKVGVILDLVKSMVLTRSFAKVALIQGGTKGIGWGPVKLLGMGDATLGSMYGLLSELTDSDAAKAADKKK
jgi:hypothetical protein